MNKCLVFVFMLQSSFISASTMDYSGVCVLLTATSEIDDYLEDFKPSKSKSVSVSVKNAKELDVIKYLIKHGDPFEYSIATHVGGGTFLVAGHVLESSEQKKFVICYRGYNGSRIFEVIEEAVAETNVGIVRVRPKFDLNYVAAYPVDYSESLKPNERFEACSFNMKGTSEVIPKYVERLARYIKIFLGFHRKENTFEELDENLGSLVEIYSLYFTPRYFDVNEGSSSQILSERLLTVVNKENLDLGKGGDSGYPVFKDGRIVGIFVRTDGEMELLPNGDLKTMLFMQAERLSYPATKQFLQEHLVLTK